MIGRRNFLQMTVGAAAAAHVRPAGPASPGGIRGATHPVRRGPIGCGGPGNPEATAGSASASSVVADAATRWPGTG